MHSRAETRNGQPRQLLHYITIVIKEAGVVVAVADIALV
jgi:hypothetical protein